MNTQFLGILKCTGLNLKGSITVNSGGIVEAKGTSEKPSQTGCSTFEGGTILVETVNLLNTLKASEPDGPSGAIKKGAFSFIAKVRLPTGSICTFTGTNIPGHYVSTASPTVLTSTDATKDITSEGGCGKGQLSGSVKLTRTSDGTNVIVH